MTSSAPPRAVLVTGAGKPGGLGAALATRLAADGWRVAVHAFRNTPGAESLAASLPGAVPVSGNLATDRGARSAVQAAASALGRLDALINNAGVYAPRAFDEITDEDWAAGLDSTAAACFFTSRAAEEHLAASGAGRIINIGDAAAGRLGPRDLAPSYHIGKAGVLLLTRSFARRLAPRGVTVNMISPGILENSVDLDTAPPIPAGRLGTFDDIWHAVRFLLSPGAAYLTGANLTVTGGWNL